MFDTMTTTTTTPTTPTRQKGSFEVSRHIQGRCDLLADDANVEFLICAGQKPSGVHQLLLDALERLPRLHEAPGNSIEK